MKTTYMLSTVASLCLLLGGSQVRAQDMSAEVINMWTSGSEVDAKKVLVEGFKKAGGTWKDTAVSGISNVNALAVSRTLGGNPAAAEQFHTGKEFADLATGGLLANIDAVVVEQDWQKNMPKQFMDALTVDGHVYGAPTSINNLDRVWYNKAVLEKLGASEPTNWNDLFPLLDKASKAGFIPLAFGDQPGYERYLFNAVLAGQGGSKLWTGLYGDGNAELVKSDEFKSVVETFLKLHDYVDSGAPGRNWNDATNLVIQGKALMQIMGDWAKGEFTAAGQTPGKEFGCTSLINPGGGTVFNSDLFVFPKLKSASEATNVQLALARVIGDPLIQVDFALKKGAIPARLDVDSSKLDMCAKSAATNLANKDVALPAQEMLQTPDQVGRAQDAISRLWNNPTMDRDQFAGIFAAVIQK